MSEIESAEQAQELLSEEFGFQVHIREAGKVWRLQCFPLDLQSRIEREPKDTLQDMYAAAERLLQGEMDRKEATTPNIRSHASQARSDRRHEQASTKLSTAVEEMREEAREQRRLMAKMDERLMLLQAENERLRQLSSPPGPDKDGVHDAEFEETGTR